MVRVAGFVILFCAAAIVVPSLAKHENQQTVCGRALSRWSPKYQNAPLPADDARRREIAIAFAETNLACQLAEYQNPRPFDAQPQIMALAARADIIELGRIRLAQHEAERDKW